MVEGSYCLWEWGGRAVSPLPTPTLHPRLHSGLSVHPPHEEQRSVHLLMQRSVRSPDGLLIRAQR